MTKTSAKTAAKSSRAAAAKPRKPAPEAAAPAKPAAPKAVARPTSYAPAAAGDFEPARRLLRQAVANAPSINAVEQALGLAKHVLRNIVADGSTKVPSLGTAQQLAGWLGVGLDDLLAGRLSDRRAALWPLDRIVAGRNPRQHFDEEALAELAASIAADGLLQPLVVRPLEGEPAGRAELVAGERRTRALRRLEAEARARHFPGDLVPVIVRGGLDDVAARVAAIVENDQREDLTGWELTKAIGELADDTGLDAKALAARLGRNPRAVQMHVKVWRELAGQDRADYEAGRIGFKAARELVADRREAEAPAEAVAAAPSRMEPLYTTDHFAADARYAESGDGLFVATVRVEDRGSGTPIAEGEGKSDNTPRALAEALARLFTQLGAVLQDAPEQPAEAADLANLLDALAVRAFASAETVELYQAAARDLRAAHSPTVGEPGSPAAPAEVLFDRDGARLALQAGKIGSHRWAIVATATLDGATWSADALEEDFDRARAVALDALAHDLADDLSPVAFPLAEALLAALGGKHWRLGRDLWDAAPGGWIDAEGNVKPTETLVVWQGRQVEAQVALEVAEAADGWRAGGRYRINYNTTIAPIRSDAAAFATRDEALAAGAAAVARRLRDEVREGWHSADYMRAAAAILEGLAPHFAKGDAELAKLPPKAAAVLEDKGGEGEAEEDRGGPLPTKAALLVAKRAKTHALRDATMKRQDVCKALVCLSLLQGGGTSYVCRLRSAGHDCPADSYSSPAVRAALLALAPALGDLVEHDERHGRFHRLETAGLGRRSPGLLRRLVELPADQLNRLFCALVAGEVVTAHGYDGAPGDHAEAVALAEILAVDVRHSWSDDAAEEPAPYTLEREYLEGCSKAMLQAIAAKVGAVKVTASTKKAEAVDMILEHLPTDARARDWLPAPFHFATKGELPRLGLGRPASPRPRRDVAEAEGEGDAEGEGEADAPRSSLLADLDEATGGAPVEEGAI